MNDSLAYILSRFFLYGAFTAPLISFVIIRKARKRIIFKILHCVLLTIVIGALFLAISMLLFLRSGKVT